MLQALLKLIAASRGALAFPWLKLIQYLIKYGGTIYQVIKAAINMFGGKSLPEEAPTNTEETQQQPQARVKPRKRRGIFRRNK